jgi:hypothetical protein
VGERHKGRWDKAMFFVDGWVHGDFACSGYEVQANCSLFLYCTKSNIGIFLVRKNGFVLRWRFV